MNFRTIANPKRGCGHLKEGGLYLQGCEKSEDGILPAFVEFVAYLPTLEGHFRGFEYVNGLQFLLVNTPKEKYRSRGYNQGLMRSNLNMLGWPEEKLPLLEEELNRHIARMIDDKGKTRVSNMNFQGCRTMPQVHSQDILMYVGETYYKTPDDFIEECYNMGFSKRIKLLPGCIWPGKTRVFFAHMRAIPDPENPDDPKKRTPGVFGYAYLNQAIYVKRKDGKVPEKVIDLHKTGKLEIVETQDVTEEDDSASLDDFEEDE